MRFEKCPVQLQGSLACITVESIKWGDQVVEVDTEDLHKLAGWNLAIQKSIRDSTFYCRISKSRKSINTQFLLHRYIMDAEEGTQVDHVCGDGLRNSKVNLRVCSNQENGENKHKLQTNNTSGVRGVDYRPKTRKWRARATRLGLQYHLGDFNLVEAAERACINWRMGNMPFSTMDQTLVKEN